MIRMDYTETRNYIAQKIQEADDFLTGDKSCHEQREK